MVTNALLWCAPDTGLLVEHLGDAVMAAQCPVVQTA
jgi:hypothetical protein